MNAQESSVRKVAEGTSVVMFMAGILTVGLGGFLLLCGLAYAMVTENWVLGAACGVILMAQYVLGVIWLSAAAYAAIPEQAPRKAEQVAEAFSHS